MLKSLNWLPGWLPTDELVGAIKEQGRQIEELQQSFDKKVGWEQTRNQTMVQLFLK